MLTNYVMQVLLCVDIVSDSLIFIGFRKVFTFLDLKSSLADTILPPRLYFPLE